MQLTVHNYIDRRFHWKTWNCWTLCRTAWAELTGLDLPFETPETIRVGSILDGVANALQQIESQGLLREGPKTDPALVLFESRLLPPHGGVLYRNLLLHVTPFDHTRYEPLDDVMARGQFEKQRFFT